MVVAISSSDTGQEFGMARQSCFLFSFLALMLVLQPLEAQPNSQKVHAIETNTPAGKQTNLTVGHDDSAIIHEAWFFYLSSLGITITAGSALLVALAIVKMQSLAVSLTAI